MSSADKPYTLSIKLFRGPIWLNALLTCLAPIIDRLLSFHKLNKVYQEAKQSTDNKDSFAQKTLSLLQVDYSYVEEQLEHIPKTGPVVIVCNHPFGAIDGLILSQLLVKVRPDFKILANVGLSLIPEIREHFIFTNPLKPNNPKNVRSLKDCMNWLKNDGALALFPSGTVAHPQEEFDQTITDTEWQKLIVTFTRKVEAAVVPIHFTGGNSSFFYKMGKLNDRFRLLMLVREMFYKRQEAIKVNISKPIPYSQVKNHSDEKMKDYFRMRCFLMSQQSERSEEPNHALDNPEPLAEPMAKSLLQSEIDSLPSENHLVDYKHFKVYFAKQAQCPNIVKEIGRLRERTYRDFKEGSGKSADNDDFDATYIQLFIWDTANQDIIGAYRLGALPELLKNGDKNELYLSALFDYPDEFLSAHPGGLETGRSFMVKEHQKKSYGLLLLWQGICAFTAANPDYCCLFGTVSISREYDPRSIALMQRVLLGDKEEIPAKNKLEAPLPIDVEQYLKKHPMDLRELSTLVKAIEADGKDIPILVKQYLKLGGVFKSIAVDKGFGNTPGAFVLVDLRKTPDKVLKMYMGAEALKGYREYWEAKKEIQAS